MVTESAAAQLKEEIVKRQAEMLLKRRQLEAQIAQLAVEEQQTLVDGLGSGALAIRDVACW
jgi:hypothetical protein